MKAANQREKTIIHWIVIAFALVLTACQENTSTTSVLSPRGDGAAQIANLWWAMLIIAAVIYIQVISILLLALFRRRPAIETDDLPPPDIAPTPPAARTFVIASGIAIPVAVLSVVFLFNVSTLRTLAPPSTDTDLTIEVVGRRWWWEVRYPQYGVVTANEIHIPTNTRVELRLTSGDVIHSLWVPALNGKIDLIPGQTNRMSLFTDEAGDYRGQCAELCGVQHTKMAFYVRAQPPDEFAQWIERQQQPAPIPEDDLTRRGQQIFFSAACVYCHTIQGTGTSGVIGPDLTHLASRKTLGAGSVPNTRGNLAGWIIDSQSIKPGNLMPPVYLEGADLQALLTYLETLE